MEDKPIQKQKPIKSDPEKTPPKRKRELGYNFMVTFNTVPEIDNLKKLLKH